MLAFPEKQKDRHLAGFVEPNRSSAKAFAKWGSAEVPWVPSPFPGFVEVQHVVGALALASSHPTGSVEDGINRRQ